MSNSQSILLLGGGYTLQQLISQVVDPSLFVITSRSLQTVNQLASKGFAATQCDILDSKSIELLLDSYPNLSLLVDSVPPLVNKNTLNSSIDSFQSGLSLIAQRLNYSIYLSTTGVYGCTNGETVDENSELNPSHPRANARVIAEITHRTLFKSSTVLRLPAIYGPGRGIGHAIKSGRYRIIDNGQRFTNRIHVEDLASIIFELSVLGIDGKTLPTTLCVTDSHPCTQQEIVDFYCKTFGLERPPTIELEQAAETLDPTMLSNQLVSNSTLLKTALKPLKYPSYKLGAFSEMSI